MRLSKKFMVPAELALLYEFVNTLDLRRYVEHGAAHTGGDEIATPAKLAVWMRARRLLARDRTLSRREFQRGGALRAAIRAFLAEPRRASQTAAPLSAIALDFPLTVAASGAGTVALQAAPGSNGLAVVLAQLQHLADVGELARLKVCASEECRWVFFDRSRPANRRWCSSQICGNRQKTRAWRARQRDR